MTTLFLTGFPGFLGSALIERLLGRTDPDITISCLIQSKFREGAEARAAALETVDPAWQGRIRLYEGDITQAGLGLGVALGPLQREIIEIYHLAGVYDLGVAREPALRINVDGTRHMLAFAEDCPELKRFHYVSTAYVSGEYPGEFGEEDLSKSQEFKNHYEETKYLAEVAVQQAMAKGLPATIYRPTIVTGDSKTGATQKYDGPYFYIRWILRQKGVAFLPVVGDRDETRVNVAPRDFVIDALAHLSGIEKSLGQVYHLSDPAPPTVNEMIEAIGEATGRRIVKVPLPKTVAKDALQLIPALQRYMGIEPETAEYFVSKTTYSCTNTLRDLAGTGITCPPFREYVGNLVAFMKEHPEISSEAMV